MSDTNERQKIGDVLRLCCESEWQSRSELVAALMRDLTEDERWLLPRLPARTAWTTRPLLLPRTTPKPLPGDRKGRDEYSLPRLQPTVWR